MRSASLCFPNTEIKYSWCYTQLFCCSFCFCPTLCIYVYVCVSERGVVVSIYMPQCMYEDQRTTSIIILHLCLAWDKVLLPFDIAYARLAGLQASGYSPVPTLPPLLRITEMTDVGLKFRSSVFVIMLSTELSSQQQCLEFSCILEFKLRSFCCHDKLFAGQAVFPALQINSFSKNE